jgi:ubiquinone/menaquinone biosynthesis C-methylase UbiE
MKLDLSGIRAKHSTRNLFVKAARSSNWLQSEISRHGAERTADRRRVSMVNFGDREPSMEKHLPGAGKSSFELIDAKKLFGCLNLAKGSTLVDLGCGRGEYAREAALRVGENGTVYAMDLWEEGLVGLRTEAESLGLLQLKVLAADICATLFLQDQSVDVCFIATVLHDLVREGCADGTIQEVRRILRPQGRLAIVEFKKFDGHPGPPINVKLAPDQVEQIVAAHRFTRRQVTEIGPYNYLITFDTSPSI